MYVALSRTGTQVSVVCNCPVALLTKLDSRKAPGFRAGLEAGLRQFWKLGYPQAGEHRGGEWLSEPSL